MKPQKQNQTGAAQVTHFDPLAVLLEKPHVPSKTPRFVVPKPKKRKWKMVWVETTVQQSFSVCAICYEEGCGCRPRERRTRLVTTRVRKRQYIDE